ncbi:MAG TPA: histidine kinase dimerization/phospho-acceptor domain-containing protein [Syntrophorhabdaceae bacterium]|nr:histidine kinase dimerization/phospho-acceptor domain-containing protein [Syntrophorhabdaceae bacterium]
MESIGRLAGGVAHDFNNILSVIIGYGEIIQDRLSNSDPLKDYIKQIVEAGKRAAGLTNQLLVFSKKSHPFDIL